MALIIGKVSFKLTLLFLEKPKNENKRINFLHKAAFLVSMQGGRCFITYIMTLLGTATNDAFAKISRGYARISKEVSNKEALKACVF